MIPIDRAREIIYNDPNKSQSEMCEVLANGEYNPADAIDQNVSKSDIIDNIVSGDAAGIGGLIELPAKKGEPKSYVAWLATSEGIEKKPRYLLRNCKKYFEVWRERLDPGSRIYMEILASYDKGVRLAEFLKMKPVKAFNHFQNGEVIYLYCMEV